MNKITNKFRSATKYLRLCTKIIRYNLSYRPSSNRKIKYIFLSWHRDEKQPMYLTMDFNKTESMGGDVWADLFSPIFNRQKKCYDRYLTEQVNKIMEYLNPQKCNTLKQRVFYYIAFGHITRFLKNKVFIIVNQRNRYYINLLAPYLEIKYPKAKIIIQYIDSVELCKIADINQYKKLKNCEVYSFDKKDAKKYELKNYNWYVDDSRLLSYSKVKPKYDASFIGEDKGRVKELKKLGKILDQHKISFNWHVVFSDDFEKSIGVKKTIGFEYDDEYLSTFDYQRQLCNSKAIVELLQDGQFGPTLNLANVVFLRRKLITDNKNVINEACYDKHNIFILGENKVKDLKKFIESPYKILPKKITEKYTYEYMLRQLGKENKE